MAPREKKATMITGNIDHFTENGIVMQDGQKVDTDFIITATGLNMQQNFPFSTIKVHIDGQEYNAADHMIYNTVMINNVPNFAFIIGYSNSSLTLKADIASTYFAKLLNHMKENNVEKLVPKEDQMDNVKRLYFSAGLTSGYLVRSRETLPKIGDKAPWSANHYFFELFNLTFKKLSLNSLEMTVADKCKKKVVIY